MLGICIDLKSTIITVSTRTNSMTKSMFLICALIPFLGQAQHVSIAPNNPASIFRMTYPYLGEEMIITNSYKAEETYGVILIEENHAEQEKNTIFLSRLVEKLHIRSIGLEGLYFSVPVSKAVITNKFEKEHELFSAYCFENLEDDYSKRDEEHKLSNAEFIYLNYDSINLIPIELEEVYDRIDNYSFESPAYYLQTAGIGIVKEKDAKILSAMLATDWVSLQKYTTTLRNVKVYFN